VYKARLVRTKDARKALVGNVVVPLLRVVAIDGPAGAGKSTIAKALAKELRVPYLDTGAMYRMVTYAALRDRVELSDEKTLGQLARDIEMLVEDDTAFVDGIDVTQVIRGPEVTKAVSVVAAVSTVRNILREQQREWVVRHNGGVVEGRDIGTVVFPDATLKVFLTASPLIRAQRRVAEYGGDVEQIAALIDERDRLDSSRQDSPLREADDSIILDTSDLAINEIVTVLSNKVSERESRELLETNISEPS